MLHRVLTAAREAGADPIVVVGPSELDIHIGWAWRTQEDPPGGGPVPGIVAGLALCQDADEIAILGGDLPFVTAAALETLRGAQVSLFRDERRQPMVSVWTRTALQTALDRGARSMIGLLEHATVRELQWEKAGPPPWYDCDTPQALEEARRWFR